ncbi:rhodanese domain-containing protein CG4456-like [Centruroides vittatus]|uniref:rhodanese domain-containing protein CG4456-like n=1 Tax=Centruroides vittatus TaxID=120091 RepID=UPI0035103BBC
MSLRKALYLLNILSTRRIAIFKMLYSSSTSTLNTLDLHKLHYRKMFEVHKKCLSEDSTMSVQDIKFEDLKQQLENSKIVLIDVRESDELAKDGRIPGSINIPLGEVEKAFSMIPDKFQNKYGISFPSKSDSQLVFSCRSGRRATMAVQQIQKMGFSQVKCYLGSFQDWVEKGGDIEKC